MKSRDLFDMILLAALWGGSFLFMRYDAPAFGVVPLIWLRMVIAAACLMPLLLWRGQGNVLRENAGMMVLMGVFSTALPYVLIAWAMLSITSGLASILNAAGASLTSAVLLLPLAWWYWPAEMPGLTAWLAVIGLGAGSTALALLLFFRLIANIGAARAISVTFLIPLFGVLWGSLFLHETLNVGMLFGGGVVLLGTALATGVLRLPGLVKRAPM